MKIEVKQQHIDKGRPNSTVSCPIAYAIKDAPVGSYIPVSVDGWGITVGNHYYACDNAIADWIYEFDSDATQVRPFVIELDAGEARVAR